MTMRLMAGVVALALVGCSSGSSSAPADPLVGKWVGATSTSAGQCTPALAFNGTVYEYDLICTLQGGALGVEAEVGNYTEKNGVLSVTPTAASCRVNRTHAPETISYTVNGTTMRVVTASGALVLDKVADDPNSVGSGGATATVEYGCANVGGFVASSIETL